MAITPDDINDPTEDHNPLKRAIREALDSGMPESQVADILVSCCRAAIKAADALDDAAKARRARKPRPRGASPRPRSKTTAKMTTPEMLVYRTSVPEWAAGAECVETGREDYEVWQLRRDGETIGWMYDEGEGYRFAEGEHNVPAEA